MRGCDAPTRRWYTHRLDVPETNGSWVVPTHFFRVDGADQETGEETYLVLQAESKPQAEKIARKQGLLISSVRVAKPADWQPSGADDDQDLAPAMEEAAPAIEEPDVQEIVTPPVFVDSTIASEGPVEEALPDAAFPEKPAQRRSAGAIVLGCVGVALVAGGVLALALALWPDTVARNELQQIDFRLDQLDQTILGGMLVLGGLVVFLMAAVLSLIARTPK